MCNVSKETTAKELISVEGVPEKLVRMQTINFCGGRTNAVEFCSTMYGMPSLDTLLNEFRAKQTAEQVMAAMRLPNEPSQVVHVQIEAQPESENATHA